MRPVRHSLFCNYELLMQTLTLSSNWSLQTLEFVVFGACWRICAAARETVSPVRQSSGRNLCQVTGRQAASRPLWGYKSKVTGLFFVGFTPHVFLSRTVAIYWSTTRSFWPFSVYFRQCCYFQSGAARSASLSSGRLAHSRGKLLSDWSLLEKAGAELCTRLAGCVVAYAGRRGLATAV